MLNTEPTCAICGARLSQLTIFEHWVVKRYTCWCVNSDCARSGVMLNDAEDAPVVAVEIWERNLKTLIGTNTAWSWCACTVAGHYARTPPGRNSWELVPRFARKRPVNVATGSAVNALKNTIRDRITEQSRPGMLQRNEILPKWNYTVKPGPKELAGHLGTDTRNDGLVRSHFARMIAKSAIGRDSRRWRQAKRYVAILISIAVTAEEWSQRRIPHLVLVIRTGCKGGQH